MSVAQCYRSGIVGRDAGIRAAYALWYLAQPISTPPYISASIIIIVCVAMKHDADLQVFMPRLYNS